MEIVATIAIFGFLNRWNDSMATQIEDEQFEFATKHLSEHWDAGKHQQEVVNPGSHEDRRLLEPAHHQQIRSQAFSASASEFGGGYYRGLARQEGDIVSSEYSCFIGFAETDLDGKLQTKRITHLYVVGCISKTCIEATVRNAVDLAYHGTVVTDAMAAFSPTEHNLAVEHSFRLIAHATATTKQVVQQLADSVQH